MYSTASLELATLEIAFAWDAVEPDRSLRATEGELLATADSFLRMTAEIRAFPERAPIVRELIHDGWSARQAALAASEYGKWLRPLPTL